MTSECSIKKFNIFNSNTVAKFLSSIEAKESPSERDCMLFMGVLTTQILCEQFIKA
jgi:Ni,Fe-hydrogenase III small subunit